jgi:DNA repair ATPase RecN
VRVAPNGVRLSRITPHGEEMIDGDPTVKALAVKLWAQVAGGAPVSYQPLDDLKAAASLIERAKADLAAPLQALDTILQRLHAIEARLTAIEQLARSKTTTREDIRAWILDALSRPASPLFPVTPQ